MSTLHPGAIDAAVTYQQLVDVRRAYGDAVFGDRHLHRDDLPDTLVQELADTNVYLRLEQQRWRRTQPIRDGRLAGRLNDAIAAAKSLGRSATQALGRGDYQDVFQRRWKFGADTYGDAYLHRDNLAEALEEIADAQIACLLEHDRRRHHGTLDPATQTSLRLLERRICALGHLVCILRTAALQPAGA